MRLSVAMTTYRGARYVEEQMASLLAQTRQADEVIITDDCSGDNTAGIVSSFIESHSLSNWHFSVNDRNLGYKQNFKEAISRTTGDIIFLCDQDDIWQPDKLAEMEQVFAANPQCKALNTGFSYIDGAGTPIEITPAPGKCNNNLIKREIAPGVLERIEFDEITAYNITPGCTMAFRAELKAIYLQRTVCGVVHDWELNLIAALLNGCYFLNRSFIHYRIHGNNVIGIPGMGEKGNVNRGAYSYRLSIARQMKEWTDCFCVYMDLLDDVQKQALARQVAFVNARYEALLSKKIIRILSLYRYYLNYRNSVTRKGRLADLVCIFQQ